MMIKVAAYQACVKSTLNERKEHILEILSKADEQRIDFLCLPEGFLNGYYAEKDLAEENSLEVSGREFQNWLREISSFRVTAIVGFNEKKGDKIFDAAAVIERGRLLGIQRKHYLYHNYFASDYRFSVFKSKGVTFGVIICLDTNYFEPARLLALQQAAIFFSPMCNKVSLDHPFACRPPYYSQFIARTHENKSWLVGADWIYNDEKSVCPGHSCIYDPDGKEIVRSEEGKEHFITANIHMDRLFHEKGRRVEGSSLLNSEMIRLQQSIHDEKSSKLITLDAYNNSVQEFASNTKALHPQEPARNFLTWLPGKRILDLGCGPGRDSQIFVEQGFRVTGVDLSPKMIEMARSRVDAQFYVMDIENLDFPTNSFDGVWASASLLHVPKKKILQVFKDLYSLLVEEGIFFLSLKKGSVEGLQSDPRYGNVQKFWSFFEKEEVEGILEQADFKVLQSLISERKSTDQGHLAWITVLCKKGRQ